MSNFIIPNSSNGGSSSAVPWIVGGIAGLYLLGRFSSANSLKPAKLPDLETLDDRRAARLEAESDSPTYKQFVRTLDESDSFDDLVTLTADRFAADRQQTAASIANAGILEALSVEKFQVLADIFITAQLGWYEYSANVTSQYFATIATLLRESYGNDFPQVCSQVGVDYVESETTWASTTESYTNVLLLVANSRTTTTSSGRNFTTTPVPYCAQFSPDYARLTYAYKQLLATRREAYLAWLGHFSTQPSFSSVIGY